MKPFFFINTSFINVYNFYFRCKYPKYLILILYDDY